MLDNASYILKELWGMHGDRAVMSAGAVRLAGRLRTCPLREVRKQARMAARGSDQVQAAACLLAQSYGLRYSSPRQGYELGYRAYVLCKASAFLPLSAAQDITLAMYLMNAARCAECSRKAFRWWRRANAGVDEHPGLPHSLLSQYFRLSGTLWSNLRHFDRAVRALSLARQHSRVAGDSRAACWAAVQTAYTWYDSGNQPQALHALQHSLPLSEGADPSLVLSAYHLLTYLLADLGHLEAAVVLFASLQPLYDALDEPLVHLRRDWVRGRLALAAGRPGAAVADLARVKAGFVERGLSYDAALTALDLARAYARQGRHSDVRRLAEEMVPVFSAHGIEREARMALLGWVEAVRREQTDLAAVEGVAAELAEIRRRPVDLGRLPRDASAAELG